MMIELAAMPMSRRAKPRPANGTLMAQPLDRRHQLIRPSAGIMSLAWALGVERVTRIELALSAWEADVLPLNYTRRRRPGRRRQGMSVPEPAPASNPIVTYR